MLSWIGIVLSAYNSSLVFLRQHLFLVGNTPFPFANIWLKEYSIFFPTPCSPPQNIGQKADIKPQLNQSYNHHLTPIIIDHAGIYLTQENQSQLFLIIFQTGLGGEESFLLWRWELRDMHPWNSNYPCGGGQAAVDHGANIRKKLWREMERKVIQL